MENKNLPEVQVSDFTEEEKEALADYRKNGCPGLTKLTDTQAFQWFELYMSGKTYSEIAQITRQKRDLILYVSAKAKWHEHRMRYYGDMSRNILKKYEQTRIESVNTVATGISALNKYFGKKFHKFIQTGDESVVENMDTKLLSQYYKSIETLNKIVGASIEDPEKVSKPLVNINMSGGKVTQTDENTLEIETEKQASDILKILAKNKKKNDNPENDD